MKRVLKIVAIILGVLIVIVIALPFFVDANLFRPRIESELTSALGRQVKVGNLSLSILKGGVTADDIAIADDPAFNKAPFVKAKSLNVGVELIPLIFSKALHVTDLSLNGPEIALVRSENGDKWNFSSLGNSAAAATGNQPATPAAKTTDQPSATTSGGNPNLSVAKLKVNDGRVTLSRADSSDKPRVYDKVNIEVRNFSFASSFPFQVTANLPSGGSLKLDGTAGAIDPSNAAHTPLQAKVSVKQMDLASSGFIDPASGISGIADFDGNVASDGREAKTTGTLKAASLKVVQKGSPAGQPVLVKYTLTHNLVKELGVLTQGEIAMGKAVAHLAGTYDAHEKVTSVNMKIAGQGMPVDDLEAMLPDVSEAQRGLDVVLLHRLILEKGLEISAEAVTAEKNVGYEREMEAALAAVDRGEAQLACLLNPVRVQQVADIALGGEVLPQKSTDFYPKLLSGIAIYKVEGRVEGQADARSGT